MKFMKIICLGEKGKSIYREDGKAIAGSNCFKLGISKKMKK